jgi:hypothetical protein
MPSAQPFDDEPSITFEGANGPSTQSEPSTEGPSGWTIQHLPPPLSTQRSEYQTAGLATFGMSNANDVRGVLRPLQPNADDGHRRQPMFYPWCPPATSHAERRRQRALERGFLRPKRV